MPLTVGGGVRTLDDVRVLLRAGADKVSINTAAVADRSFVARAAEKFGNQCIVVAIDAKRVSGEGERAPLGNLHPWRPQPHRDRRRGLCPRGGEPRSWRNPADLDGSRRHARGFDIPLTRAISDAVSVPVIASGGVGTLDHLVEGIRDGGATAVLAASIFHFGDYTIGEAKRHMAAAGLPVRLD